MFPKKYARSPGQAGFSLLELMVVMAIVAVLAASCAPILRIFLERARVAAGITAGKCIQNAFSAAAAVGPNFTYPIVNDHTELATVSTANGCPLPPLGDPDSVPPVTFGSMFCYIQDPITHTIFIVPCDPGVPFDYRLDLFVTGVADTIVEVDSLMGVRARPAGP